MKIVQVKYARTLHGAAAIVDYLALRSHLVARPKHVHTTF